MEILYVLLPVSVLLVLVILAVMGWAVNSGQFEDIEQEGMRILGNDLGKEDEKLASHQD
jgi:cbb3-type cytochrome oxidase maturation protein